jgi:anthranilate phosphoribosyltransferase
MSPTDEPGRPTLRVIRGDATDEEIAALLAVLVARKDAGAETTAAAAQASDAAQPISAWSDRAAGVRRPISAGPGAWRASAWQR